MGRFKNVEIKGLLIEDFDGPLMDVINTAKKESKLTEKEFFKKLAPGFDELSEGYEDIITSTYLKHNNFKLDRFLETSFRNQRKIAEANRESFTTFIIYVHTCSNIYDKIVDKVKRKRIDSVLKTNIALYGLIVRRAHMIVDLLLSGYIDGAMIIWRSMYESVIVLLVLALENNNELANGYFKHSLRHSKKKIISYSKHYKELKFKPLPASTERKLNRQVSKIESKHGKDFLENEYGWADCLFPGKQRASFRLLEEKVEMQRLRPYYLVCCEHVHPTFDGFRRFVEGNRIMLARMMAQEIDLQSFVDSMQFTIYILHEINHYILYEFSVKEEFEVNFLLLEKIFRKQQESFDQGRQVKH